MMEKKCFDHCDENSGLVEIQECQQWDLGLLYPIHMWLFKFKYVKIK